MAAAAKTAQPRRRPGARRKPTGRPQASLARRILALLEAAPEAVLRPGAIAAQVGAAVKDVDAPLTALALGNAVIELRAGFCLATPANRARLRAEEAAAAAVVGAAAPGALARGIVSRAHFLRREGWSGRATEFLRQAARGCACPRIAVNFLVLADLFGEGPAPYRNVTRAEAARLAQQAGVRAERRA